MHIICFLISFYISDFEIYLELEVESLRNEQNRLIDECSLEHDVSPQSYALNRATKGAYQLIIKAREFLPFQKCRLEPVDEFVHRGGIATLLKILAASNNLNSQDRLEIVRNVMVNKLKFFFFF